jgi:hypothetical protein
MVAPPLEVAYRSVTQRDSLPVCLEEKEQAVCPRAD